MPVAVASGDVTVAGSAAGRVYVRGVSPQITPAPWVVEPGENGATIVGFPAAPIYPEWSISTINELVTVDNFPRFPVQSIPVFAVNVSGSARGRTLWSVKRVAVVGTSANGVTLILPRGF